MRNTNIHRVLFLLLSIIGLLLLGSYVGINLLHYTAAIDSDIAAEGLTARAMWEHGQVIPSTFYGSTETRIFNVNLLGAGLYGLTQDMNLSMGIVCSIMMVLLLVAYGGLMRRLRMNAVQIATGIVLLLAAPVTLRHAQILYVQAVYYAIHSILMLVTLAMWLHVIHTAKGWIPRTLLSCALAFVISLSGMRAALICYAPLVETVILGWIVAVLLRGWRQAGDYARMRSMVFSIATFASAYVGTRMPTSVSVSTSRNIRAGFNKLLNTVIPEMLECAGFHQQDGIRNVMLDILLMAMVASILLAALDGIRDVLSARKDASAQGDDAALLMHSVGEAAPPPLLMTLIF